MKNVKPKVIDSISELHRLSGLCQPSNPLITIIGHHEKVDDIKFGKLPGALNFYNITIKRSFHGQLRFGIATNLYSGK